MVTVVLKVMGPPTLVVEDPATGERSIPLSRTGQAFLALLALSNDGRSLSRALVAETLWPDTAPDKSASRLSSALCRLTRALGPGCPILQVDQGQIGLTRAPCFSVDILAVARCTEALRNRPVEHWEQPELAALEAAINRRTGAFLDGIDGDWVMAARQRCAEIYEAGLEALIRFHRRHGHVNRSIAAARKLVQQDPYREDAQAVLVELYGHSGQRSRALAQFADCSDLLRRDLGIEPGGALKASLDAAVASRPGGVPASPELLEMLRRVDRSVDRLARQLGEIQALLARGAAGAPDPEPPVQRRRRCRLAGIDLTRTSHQRTVEAAQPRCERENPGAWTGDHLDEAGVTPTGLAQTRSVPGSNDG